MAEKDGRINGVMVNREGGPPLNNSVAKEGDRSIRNGLCGDQSALPLPGMRKFLTALANRLGISPAGVSYAIQRGECIAPENGYQLIP